MVLPEASHPEAVFPSLPLGYNADLPALPDRLEARGHNALFLLESTPREESLPLRPKGEHAARLREQKYHWLRRFEIPQDALPGSLSLAHRKCGKPNCSCVEGEGHPLWSLTFMVEGKKRVESIPEDWVDEVRRRVEEGREFKQAVVEVFAANAQLVVMERRQRRQ